MSERSDFEADLAHSLFEDPQQTISVLWYRDGIGPGKPIDVGFDDSQDPGVNQVDGDGTLLDTPHGKRIRSSAFLDAPVELEFKPEDTFLIYGELWSYRRPVGRDSARQTILIVINDGDFTRQPRLRRH